MSTHSTQKPFFARIIRKFSILVVLAWAAFTVVINTVVPQLEPVTDANQGPLVPLDAPSSRALIHIGESFQESDSNSLAMVILEGDHKLNDADHKFYDVLASKLENDKKHVQYVMNLWGQGTTAAGVQSSDGQAAYTLVRVAGDQGSTVSDESIRAVRELVAEVQPPNGVKVYVSGSAPLSTDMLQVGNQSMIRLMYVTIAIITVMLLIVYRSVATALLTLVVVMVELSCGRGVVAFLAYHKLIGISVFASNILVSLILGAGTDYAIFLIGRYQEARHAGEDRETAYYSAVKGVSHVILGSGLAIAGATFCLQFTRLNYFNTMGIPCAAATLVAVAASLTFGPAVLALGSRFGVFEPKVKASAGIWRKVGTVTVRWPGRILVVSSVVVLIGSITLPSYRPNYNDRIYIADDIPANQGYAAADRHFPVSKLNSDMLMIESDHDMRNSTDMIALDKVAREVFHTPGVAMIQSVTRPLGTPLEHSSFTYTMGTMGTKINELIPFLTDLTDRFTQMADITDRMAALMRQQQELTGQQAGSAHISLKGAQELKDVTVSMRDTLGNFDDQFRPLRNYFYWEPHCADIPMCWAMRSLFDMTDQVDSMTDAVDDSLKAAVIQDAVTPQLVEVIGKSAAELDNMRKVVLTEQSTMRPMLTQMNELGRQMMDLGYAFDSSKNDEFFYLPPDAFDNPYFQIDLKYFVSPDGKSARYMIYHDGEALSEEGIQHAQAYLPAAKEALKGTTLAGSRVYLGGAAATYWDIQDATKTDLLIAAIAAFALIFLVMLLITRSVVAALVIIGTVAFSYSGAFGLSVLVWQHFLGIPLSWLNLPITFIILVAVGSDYNLLLIARYLEESKAGLNTGLIRAVANSGKVVTTAGIVFATTMMAMLSSDLLSVGQLGSIIGLGLLLDTLIVRSFITPAIARLLGPLFWWPRVIRSRPLPAR
ncbi:Membrane transport protein mmpL8 [Mycobacteroides salmoniphilum]|uniref:Membrane transport protein mmpL8 n=1 Tax=Mycobacteroides salmoniphilum TaxID=404941 RepID=A0A4R8S3T4_9MYCO|nr:RND family transporter [Mycobacteroides salmoniphilum]TDZ77892.1 Membrane transport protein mmpL8 [Mycobacteroides salmoniphilum]TDZ82523.1 Membrane transport protein mmpL8 [Mycobacteroides salmoniphilum]TDZ85536.1 Membrane transport protein mmpL8 [Mycobacteroides salmoniphilum]